MESRTMICACALAALTAMPSATTAQQRHEFRELHMGMEVRVVLFESDDARARTAARAAFDRIAALEDVMSDYRADSELRRLEQHHREWVVVSKPLFAVLSRAVEVAAVTNGAFDPTAGPLVELWREARSAKRLPQTRSLDSARALVGWRQLSLDTSTRSVRLANSRMRLDLGGIAKGYILGEAVAELRKRGLRRTMVVAGGDIALGDAPPGEAGWAIVTRHDSMTHRLNNACVSTSGPEYQFVEIDGVRYSHVVNPRTGLALTDTVSASVIVNDCALADALATALAVLGPPGEKLLRDRFPGVVAHVFRPREKITQ